MKIVNVFYRRNTLVAAFISMLLSGTALAGPFDQQLNQGVSSSQTPYLLPTSGSWRSTSLLSVGDAVPWTDDTSKSYRMVGIPDGLGAYDNKDGTITVLMNHELNDTEGTTRAHGSAGAF